MESKDKPNLKEISNARDLQATFSKRLAEIFKEASDFSILCGAEIALIVFTPDNKVVSFGCPNVDSIVERFMSRVPPPPLNPDLNETGNAANKEREEHECVKEKGEKLLFAGENSSSGVHSSEITHSTPLMQNTVYGIDGSITRHHDFDNMNDKGCEDGVNFKFF